MLRVLRNEVLPALYDARFSPANPALPDPHLVEVLVRLATSTCHLPAASPIALPVQQSQPSQSAQPLAASSLPIPSQLLSTSGADVDKTLLDCPSALPAAFPIAPRPASSKVLQLSSPLPLSCITHHSPQLAFSTLNEFSAPAWQLPLFPSPAISCLPQVQNVTRPSCFPCCILHHSRHLAFSIL